MTATVTEQTIENNSPTEVTQADFEWSSLIDESALFVDKNSGGKFIPLKELRRIGEIRKIQNTTFTMLSTPDPDFKFAVVKCCVTFEDGKFYEGIGSATEDNTDDVFSLYCFEMAENRAEARALRRGLNITICSKEEIATKNMGGLDTDPEGPITTSQKRGIKLICKRQNLNVTDVLGLSKLKRLDDLTEGRAAKLLAALNSGKIQKRLEA